MHKRYSKRIRFLASGSCAGKVKKGRNSFLDFLNVKVDYVYIKRYK